MLSAVTVHTLSRSWQGRAELLLGALYLLCWLVLRASAAGPDTSVVVGTHILLFWLSQGSISYKSSLLPVQLCQCSQVWAQPCLPQQQNIWSSLWSCPGWEQQLWQCQDHSQSLALSGG